MKRIFTFAIALMSLFATVQLASAANVTFNVTVPAGTNSCWIVGNFNGWNNNDKKMTMVDATHYTITMDDATWALDGGVQVTTANIKYKYLSGGGDWAYVEKTADGAELVANRAYLPTVQNKSDDGTKLGDFGTNGVDVVAKWASVWADVPALPLDLTIDVLTPVGTIECYCVGNWQNPAWTPTDPLAKMTLISSSADGVAFEIKFHTADANKLQYHFCSGPAWAYEQDPSTNFVYPEVNPIVTKWKALYDPTKLGTINITATVPAGTGDNVWIQGDFLGWNFAGNTAGTGGQQGVKNVDGTFSFAVPNVLAISYRLYNGPGWNYAESDVAGGAELAARTANYPADANTTITVAAWKQAYNTAVQAINMSNHKIYTANHSVVVEGVTSQVDVFDASGRSVQSQKVVGTFSSKNLSSGLYIIRVDGATTKVSLR